MLADWLYTVVFNNTPKSYCLIICLEIHNKIHFISPCCPRPSIAFVSWNTIHLFRNGPSDATEKRRQTDSVASKWNQSIRAFPSSSTTYNQNIMRIFGLNLFSPPLFIYSTDNTDLPQILSLLITPRHFSLSLSLFIHTHTHTLTHTHTHTQTDLQTACFMDKGKRTTKQL